MYVTSSVYTLRVAARAGEKFAVLLTGGPCGCSSTSHNRAETLFAVAAWEVGSFNGRKVNLY